MYLTDIYRILCPTAIEYIFLSSTHRTFSRIHMFSNLISNIINNRMYIHDLNGIYILNIIFVNINDITKYKIFI